MLQHLPPEIILLLTEHLGFRACLRFASVSKHLWTLLGAALTARYRYVIYSLDAANSHSAINDFIQSHDDWESSYSCIEILKVINKEIPTTNFLQESEPNPLLWVQKDEVTMIDSVNYYLRHKPEYLEDDSVLTHSAIPRLRAIELALEQINWIEKVSLWSTALRMRSPFVDLEILRLSGDSYGIAAIREILKLPALRHLQLIGPTSYWDSDDDNLQLTPRSSNVKTLQLTESLLGVQIAIQLVAACKALENFNYWQIDRLDGHQDHLNQQWDSRAMIFALCDYQRNSLRALKLHSECLDERQGRWLPLKMLSKLESLTCDYDYFAPGSWELHPLSHSGGQKFSHTVYHVTSVALKEVLPPSLKTLRLQQRPIRHQLARPQSPSDETSWETRMERLVEFLNSSDSGLRYVKLPDHDQKVSNTAARAGVVYEAADRDGNGEPVHDSGLWSYLDDDGAWVSESVYN